MYTVLLPPGFNPIAVNEYISMTSSLHRDVQLHAPDPLSLHSLNIRVGGSQDQASDTHTHTPLIKSTKVHGSATLKRPISYFINASILLAVTL